MYMYKYFLFFLFSHWITTPLTNKYMKKIIRVHKVQLYLTMNKKCVVHCSELHEFFGRLILIFSVFSYLQYSRSSGSLCSPVFSVPRHSQIYGILSSAVFSVNRNSKPPAFLNSQFSGILSSSTFSILRYSNFFSDLWHSQFSDILSFLVFLVASILSSPVLPVFRYLSSPVFSVSGRPAAVRKKGK